MAKGSAKKPGDPKCRNCGGLLEGRPTVHIGGFKWHLECAEKKGKFVSREYRDPSLRKSTAQPEEANETPETVEMTAVDETAVEVTEEAAG